MSGEWDDLDDRTAAEALADYQARSLQIQAEREDAELAETGRVLADTDPPGFCECYDFATLEYDPAGPCAACIANGSWNAA